VALTLLTGFLPGADGLVKEVVVIAEQRVMAAFVVRRVNRTDERPDTRESFGSIARPTPAPAVAHHAADPSLEAPTNTAALTCANRAPA